MQDIQDAPWIREAETYGPPGVQDEDVYCPVCGAENPDYLYIIDGECQGCDECVKRVDAYDWIMTKREEERKWQYPA
jgi:hypothetical protein